MFIKKITIQNYRLFPSDSVFEIKDIGIPDNQNEGSGLNLFVGENSCGKTSPLDVFVLPLLSYKADGFALSDFFDPTQKTNIQIFSENIFDFKGTMPNQKNPYKGKGFLKAREEAKLLVDFDARTGHNYGIKFRMRQNTLPMLYEKITSII